MMKLNNICKNYGQKKVIENVSFELENKVYGMLGTNGSGKTTLLRIMTGLLKQTSGTIDKPQDMNIGYLPQKFGLFKDLSLYQHMEYFCCLKKIDENLWQQEIHRVLAMVNMEEYLIYKCKSLSGGMVRRVGIAQALLGKPQCVIFDEPTTGLDPEERLRFKSIISKVQGDYPIIISTHIVEDIDSLCQELFVLKDCHLYHFKDIHDFQQRVHHKISIVDQLKESHILIKEFKNQENIVKYRVISHDKENCVEETLEDAYIDFLKSDILC